MDFAFTIFPIIFTIMFLFIFGCVIVMIFKGISEWNRNNHSPKLTVPAKVISKRTNIDHHHHAGDMHHSSTSTTYYATFEVESGDRIEFHLSGHEFGLIIEGDEGMLSFQGTRYLEFKRNI